MGQGKEPVQEAQTIPELGAGRCCELCDFGETHFPLWSSLVRWKQVSVSQIMSCPRLRRVPWG